VVGVQARVIFVSDVHYRCFVRDFALDQVERPTVGSHAKNLDYSTDIYRQRNTSITVPFFARLFAVYSFLSLLECVQTCARVNCSHDELCTTNVCAFCVY